MQASQRACAARQAPAPGRATQRLRARAGRITVDVHASVVWRQLDQSGAWVAHARAARRPRAVVHFLGGAFAGAAPQVAYHLAIELLAESGLTVVTTPYRLTFKHLECARQVAADFASAVEELRAGGRAYLAPPGAPTIGVGHSNGALLHLLMGALVPGHAAANALISYNNKQVSDAVPIPGLLDNLRPTVNAARSGSATPGGPGGALPLPPAPALLASAAAAAAAAGVAVERRLVEAAAPAVEQLSTVLGEVGDGVTEFTPTPAESRALIAGGYRVPRTLLVRFEDDSIDETPEMAALLSAALGSQGSQAGGPVAGGAADAATAGSGGGEVPVSVAGSLDWADGPLLVGGRGDAASGAGSWSNRESGGSGNTSGGDGGSSSDADAWAPGGAAAAARVQQLLLPGNHLTPCGSEVAWDPDPAASQAAVRRLVREVAGWIKAVAAEERAAQRRR